MTIRRFTFIVALAAIIAHAMMSMATGSLNPGNWGGLAIAVCVLIVAPCIALGIAVIEGSLDGGPSHTNRGRR